MFCRLYVSCHFKPPFLGEWGVACPFGKCCGTNISLLIKHIYQKTKTALNDIIAPLAFQSLWLSDCHWVTIFMTVSGLFHYASVWSARIKALIRCIGQEQSWSDLYCINSSLKQSPDLSLCLVMGGTVCLLWLDPEPRSDRRAVSITKSSDLSTVCSNTSRRPALQTWAVPAHQQQHVS